MSHPKTKPIRAHFVEDPGHGWLRVSVADVRRVDAATSVADTLTSYSYLSPTWAFFEEDCDAGAFLTAAKQAGIDVVMGTETHTDRPAACREYGAFSATKLRTQLAPGLALHCASLGGDGQLTLEELPGGRGSVAGRGYVLRASSGQLYRVPAAQFWARVKPLA